MRRPSLLIGAAVLAVGLSACSEPPPPHAAAPTTPALELVAYDSCDRLLSDLRTAAKANVKAWGFGDFRWLDFGAEPANARADGAVKQPAAGPAYSGTNTHELGVDEPDLVKTDGRRIVTVVGRRLTVVDAAAHRVAGTLTLPSASERLLLSGDHALVIGVTARFVRGPIGANVDRPAWSQTSVWLVDLQQTPRILSSYTIDGAYADARQSGSVARIVVRSTPRITFPPDRRGDEQTLIQANRKIIDKAPVDAWLPAYTSDGAKGAVDCGDVRLPHSYSGTSMVTVLSFDLTRDALGSGVPASVVADGDTVYGSGSSLYIANDDRWRGPGATAGTQIYQFDLSAMRPRYTAGGTVPGWLLNQYSLSEYDGVLRVATTTSRPWAQTQSARSTSSVYALRSVDGRLTTVGEVGGLGKDEQIYAVRFVGPIGYVVTFRRTDPLYAVDLTDPVHPRVAGELKIPGYSAYLHPVDAHRLIGVGQNADDSGRVTGTQVSLFDVGDPREPSRLARLELGDSAFSEAESDPHAFLYWPDAKLLAVPVQQWGKVADQRPRIGLSLIRVDDNTLTATGWISHPAAPGDGLLTAVIRRSLVIGDELWTVSDAGVMASRLDSAAEIAWLPR